MDTSKILEILTYTIPAVVTGAIALYFFKYHTDNEEKRRNFLLRKEKQNISLPLRFQAYERMALFLERISPSKLLIRVKPSGKNKTNYQNKLIQNIEQEFEHNLVQQIYITDAAWNAVVTAKNSLIQIIRNTTADESIEDAEQLREKIIQISLKQESPSSAALSFIKNEVKKHY
ncbi:MAG: hypothetical protein ABFR05_05485 [Bacteroidota bacterium]